MRGKQTLFVLTAVGAMAGCGGGGADDQGTPLPAEMTGGTGGEVTIPPTTMLPVEGGACHTLDGSTLPMVMDELASSPPSMTGGVITDGTYVLRRYEWYDSKARLSRRKILIVFSNGARTASYYWQRNDEPEERVVATVFTQGEAISFRGQCPSGHTVEWDRFTVGSDGGLTLFSTRDAKTASFSRQ